MAQIASKESGFNDLTLLKLAREISMDMRSIDDILEVHGVSKAEWGIISQLDTFQRYLKQCVEEWNSAVNTEERVRLKSLAFVEEALPEFYARAHDPDENLNAKVEVLKTVAKFAGVGGNVDVGGGADRLTVTINMGSDQQLRVEKDITTRAIEEDRL